MIAQLRARMAKAVEAEDYETAAILRDAIERLERGESRLREQVPGRMGLGSSQEAYVTEAKKPPPHRPDPMTRGHSKAGRRR